MSVEKLDSSAASKSASSLFAVALTCWVWPLFQLVVIEIFHVSGYALTLGGSLLNFLASLLSIITAVIFSFLLYFEMKGKNSSLIPERVIFFFVTLTIASSFLVIGFFVLTGMFCRVGSCPTPN